MTSALMRALNERVMAYGSHHTLRCLALARKAIPSSNDQVRLLLHCYPFKLQIPGIPLGLPAHSRSFHCAHTVSLMFLIY
jgi:hypothetical protein